MKKKKIFFSKEESKKIPPPPPPRSSVMNSFRERKATFLFFVFSLSLSLPFLTEKLKKKKQLKKNALFHFSPLPRRRRKPLLQLRRRPLELRQGPLDLRAQLRPPFLELRGRAGLPQRGADPFGEGRR